MLDALTVFKAGLLLLCIYAASKVILYLIKRIRGVGHINVVTGTVNFVRAVGRRCVQFQLEGDARIFEMYSEESWVLYKKDEIRIAGYPDHTGKFIALAYMNISKSVFGHARLIHLPWLLVMVSIYLMGGMVYFQFYRYFVVAIAVLIYGLIKIQPDIDTRRAIYLLTR
jgi:hypothetical protein